jgi:acetyl-CoA C-acetyltransferase
MGMSSRDVVILSGPRTAIGKYGGSFRDVHPAAPGAVAARAGVVRAGLTPADSE